MLHHQLRTHDLLNLPSNLRHDSVNQAKGRLLHGQMELHRPAPHLVRLLQLHLADHHLPAQELKPPEAQRHLPDRGDDSDSDQDFLFP